ncbi:hypothetical protein [Streptomyces mirabilis]|uniref:hypothetical protein n=1 Tax=Streptomyces mirabilis TaxID=68239 RepID=UPI0031B9BB15
MSTAGHHIRLDRRALLRAAVTVPAAGVVATVLEATAAHADTAAHSGGRSHFDTESPRFALAVLPDTQYLFDADSSDPAPPARHVPLPRRRAGGGEHRLHDAPR